MVTQNAAKTLELIFDFGSPNAYLTLKVLPELLDRTGADLIITPACSAVSSRPPATRHR